MRLSSALPPILVVDDDADHVFLLQRLIAKTGVRNPILAARAGEEAIAQLRHACLAGGGKRGDKPALVILDVKMPTLGGLDVLRWIRRKKALRKTKIIMLSSSDDPTETRRALKLGADAYLIKFPSLAIIAATLREALGPGKPRRALPPPPSESATRPTRA